MTLFLANENISRTTVEMLRVHGHDVKWAVDSLPSVKDEMVLMLAAIERRIIITFDTDYGELIFKKKMKPPKGVIQLRLNSDDASEPARLILQYLAVSKDVFDNRFSVLTKTRIRFKQL